MIAWSRRRFVQAIAGGLALPAAGCKTITGPLLPACGLPPQTAGVTIDVHTHVFNASDLQVEKFLTRIAASEFSPVLQELIAALAPILQVAGWALAPRGKDELDRLDTLASIARTRPELATPLDAEIGKDRQLGLQRFLDGFTEQLRDVRGERFVRAYGAYLTSLKAAAPSLVPDRRIFALSLSSMRTPEGLATFLDAERSLPGKRPLTFALNFFHYRYVNAAYLLENYGCTNGKVGVFATHMVDFDYGLGATSRTPTDLDTQIEVMARIHVLSEGRIIPFAPFDPWRDYLEHGTALKRVRDAVAAGKSLGIKLYPPMGFAPAGNEKEVSPRPAGWPADARFPAGLDASMNALFDWCEKEGVPVLAHANRSNTAHPSFAELGNPDRWKSALRAHPGLRVCFGHFGGDCLLSHGSGCANWASGFLEAFALAPNAYADWSYFDEVLSGDGAKDLLDRARKLLTQGGDLARSRIAYGSDWMMLAIEPGAELYYTDFADLQRQLEQEFPGIGEQFFARNGARFLNLTLNGANRRRIERTFGERARPPWLDAPQLRD